MILQLNTDDFNSLLNKAARKPASLRATEFGYVDESLLSEGIAILYYNDSKHKKIKLIVYCPFFVLDENDDEDELWKLNHANIKRLINRLDKQICKYFHSDCGLNDFSLARLDLIADLDIGDRDTVANYIKVLRNIGRVKRYSPLKLKEQDGLTKENCFGLTGNSNGIEFLIHTLKRDKNVLRVEARLMKKTAVQAYSDKTNTADQIRELAERSGSIFMDVFRSIVPKGDFYKMDKARNLVRERVHDWHMKSRMIRFLTLVKEKKSLHLAYKAMSYRNYDKIMAAFAKVDVSPVTINKRQKTNHLMSLYSYFSNAQ